MSSRRVAVVTGANRGLGLEAARVLAEQGLAVVLTARTAEKAERAVTSLLPVLPDDVVLVPSALDVTSSEQASALADSVRARFGRLDVLINNAGAILDPSGASGALASDPEVVLRSFENNALSALRVTQALAPLMVETGGGNIVNVSSGMGALGDMGGGWTGYRVSKTAMNAITRILHAELAGAGVRVNAVCPGWVRTDMGGADAARSLEEGVFGIVWAATLEEDGPSGGFFRDGRPIPW